jgi:signal transduction histidine kinase/DNA-binding NarL/FixJ family response regulator
MKARVLVVDDQKISRVTVAAALAESGYVAETADSGAAGLERARAWLPDIVVLDVHMPGMDGFEVVAELKADPRTAPIPVVFLTAEVPSDDLVVRGLELGAYDFLNKGCSRAELLARVGVMARIKRGYDEQSALARVSGLAVRRDGVETLARGIAAEVARALRADGAMVVVPREEGAARVVAAVGLGPEAEERSLWLAERLADAETVACVLEPPWGGCAGGVAVPRAHGAPCEFAVFSDAPCDADDLHLLELLANQATLALDNAVLHARSVEQALTLEEQATALAQAMTERSRFFASMSHELRTPINAVLGYAGLLQDGVYGELEERQAHAVDRVVRSGRHLLDLVNDVLDISRLEAGKLQMDPQPTELASLLRDVASTVEVQARERGLSVEVEAPRSVRVETDPGRVRQIVLNLLSNAVKFTDHGGVRALLALGDGWAEIRVVDTGPGIAPEDLERIFQEFEQTDTAQGRGGTGLGLPISRRLAVLLGGSLEVERDPGPGATFILRLPLGSPA